MGLGGCNSDLPIACLLEKTPPVHPPWFSLLCPLLSSAFPTHPCFPPAPFLSTVLSLPWPERAQSPAPETAQHLPLCALHPEPEVCSGSVLASPGASFLCGCCISPASHGCFRLPLEAVPALLLVSLLQ